ncbi:ATP-binding protein [Methanoregula sp.]|uniref:ATP-binding protein n=1 Tax=Methanoregula sp. TaxID=2052170 RepID=UPI00356AA59E
MIREFIDREEERALLEREWQSAGGRLIILYGRRRIGKTRLIDEFIRDKPGILYIAEDASPHIQIGQLKTRCAEYFDDSLLSELDIKSWDQLFTYLAQKQPGKRTYLVIDEFTYLVKNDPSILSALQKAWDRSISGSDWCLLLSGSILSLMSDLALSSTSPLYGRRTRDMLLPPLRFSDARRFFHFSFHDALKAYLSIGGVPEYLLKAGAYDDSDNFFKSEFFNRYGYFYHEPYFILSQEFRELKVYQSILHAIALGNTSPTSIAQFCGLDTRHVYPYLDSMIRLGLVEKEVPVLGNPRQGIYRIRDRVFDFWYCHVFPRRQEIETGHNDTLVLDMNPFFGRQFESFVRDEFAGIVLPGYRTGHWWYKEDEIDLVALDDTSSAIVFGECKWGDIAYRQAKSLLALLKTKSKIVRADQYRHRKYALFSAGTIEGKDRLQEEGYLVFDSTDLERI